jgi:hypothetical protein
MSGFAQPNRQVGSPSITYRFDLPGPNEAPVEARGIQDAFGLVGIGSEWKSDRVVLAEMPSPCHTIGVTGELLRVVAGFENRAVFQL